jgi:hypothetical protein
MSDYSVTLSTTEPNNYVGLIKLRQGDVASQSIQATITANGQLFNFDHLAVFFNAVLPNGNVVRDKVTNVDYANSKLNYVVADSFLQEVAQVTAWFTFENSDKIIDSTKNFQYSVIAGWKECIPQGNYIYELSEIQREIEEIIGNKDFTSLISKITSIEQKYNILDNETTAKLAHKVGSGVKAELEDLSATVIGAIDGTGGPFNLLSVPQDYSVTMEKLAADARETLPIKIPSKNLFDKSKVTTGFMWDANSGAKWVTSSYSISDYIAMKANTLITTYKCVRVIEWTSDKKYIKGTSLLSGSILVITTSPTTAYITIDTQNVDLDITQIELGGTYTGYVPFKLGLKPTDIFDNSITNSKLAVSTQAFLDKAVVTQLDIILPTTVYATVGREFNIYYRNVMLTDTNLDDYDIMINVPKGQLMDDRYSFTPVAEDIGSFVAKFYIRDKKGNNLLNKNVTIEVVADVTPSTAKKVIFIGDSLTDDGSNGSYIETLKNMMGSRLELLGTRGKAPYLHEGRGGWSTVTYLTNTTATNKFWNPGTSAFDFTYYMTQQGYAAVDDVVIFIGTNDSSTNIETLITNLKTIRTSILDFNANIKVHFVLTPPPSSSFYAFGRSRLFQWDIENKFKGFNKRYITEFEPNVIPVNLNLDAWYDFPRITLTRSQRNTETIEIVEERYHCSQVGYDKFADVIYSYLMKKWA